MHVHSLSSSCCPPLLRPRRTNVEDQRPWRRLPQRMRAWRARDNATTRSDNEGVSPCAALAPLTQDCCDCTRRLSRSSSETLEHHACTKSPGCDRNSCSDSQMHDAGPPAAHGDTRRIPQRVHMNEAPSLTKESHHLSKPRHRQHTSGGMSKKWREEEQGPARKERENQEHREEDGEVPDKENGKSKKRRRATPHTKRGRDDEKRGRRSRTKEMLLFSRIR